jgi:DNA-binding MarR family transcriptional regulator
MTETVIADEIELAGELNQQVLQLTRAVHVMRTHLAATAPQGVQWSTYGLLFHLTTGGPRRAGALAECVFVDPSTVSRQVDQLVRLGLVERRADPDDGRATLLAATEAGLELHRRMRERRNRVTAEMLASWAPSDVRTLTELLGRFTTEMAEQMPALLSAVGAPGHFDTSTEEGRS